MHTPPAVPLSPTPTSASSYSLITSLDGLSLSTGSLDHINHSDRQNAGRSERSARSSHSRQSSSTGSHISMPSSSGRSYRAGPDAATHSESDDYEVILLPRSIAPSVTGASAASTQQSISRAGTPRKDQRTAVPGRDAGRSPAPSTPGKSAQIYPVSGAATPKPALTWQQLQLLEGSAKKIPFSPARRSAHPSVAYGGSSVAASDAGLTSVSGSQVDGDERRRMEKQAKKAAANKARRARRKVEARMADSETRSITSEAPSSVSQTTSASYTGSSHNDMIKVDKGKGKQRQGRRGGETARRRFENGQNREMGAVEDALGLDPSPPPRAEDYATTYTISGTSRVIDRAALEMLTGAKVSGSPSRKSVPTPPRSNIQAASLQKLHLLDLINNGENASSTNGSQDDEDEDEEEEVDGLSDLETPEVYTDLDGETPVSSPRRRRTAGSITSADDARSSIDGFLLNPSHQMSKEETLRFWQSLCYELGLAHIDEEPSLPDLPTSSAGTSSSIDDTSTSSSRSSTPTQIARPMPQTLYTARALLKSEGHVNIADYFDARQADAEASGSSLAEGSGRYAHLVQPSVSSMRKYTKSSGRFVNLSVVKAEVMQPLLRDFGFKRGREARETRGEQGQGRVEEYQWDGEA
ncbi:uncharacterized protein MKK02DRAFT_40677 [Dioszegia hungarica]|uniref:Uncharacterized protein n=1 Tax=Dioszegia hungarica TaxID=4972 RepID=A0AA38H0H7_9TREE|nr:uncharacterized protein MKK02DRAFT_40677 [Dioszegia hungarica]KAI9632373.1 hypothetical protein MKK02DRAFT_40677 [Dioszegia hungarica]